MTTQSEVQSVIDALLRISDFEDKKITKSLKSRIKREWLKFKETAISIGFEPEKHREFTHNHEGDLWNYVAHDWIKTRNLTGAGFLDGDWSKDITLELSTMAKSFGQLEVYEHGGYIFPGSYVYINKIATHCYIKYKTEPQSRLKYGYGKTSLPYMIKLPEIDTQWRRVQALCYSNNSTEIITVKGETILLGDMLKGFCIAVGDTVKIDL